MIRGGFIPLTTTKKDKSLDVKHETKDVRYNINLESLFLTKLNQPARNINVNDQYTTKEINYNSITRLNRYYTLK